MAEIHHPDRGFTGGRGPQRSLLHLATARLAVTAIMLNRIGNRRIRESGNFSPWNTTATIAHTWAQSSLVHYGTTCLSRINAFAHDPAASTAIMPCGMFRLSYVSAGDHTSWRAR